MTTATDDTPLNGWSPGWGPDAVPIGPGHDPMWNYDPDSLGLPPPPRPGQPFGWDEWEAQCDQIREDHAAQRRDEVIQRLLDRAAAETDAAHPFRKRTEMDYVQRERIAGETAGRPMDAVPVPTKPRTRMSREQASLVARKPRVWRRLLRTTAIAEWAKVIGCGAKLVKQLPEWQNANAIWAGRKKTRDVTVDPQILDRLHSAIDAENDKDDDHRRELHRLLEEQVADYRALAKAR